MMDPLLSCLQTLEAAFRSLERRVPPPRMVQLPTGRALRYAEQTIDQAIIQKLARQISGLHAMRLLMEAGFGQEQAVIQRTLDELGEDIIFLTLAAISGNVTDLHLQYLEEFWKEEFDGATPLASNQKRGMVRRSKIRAAISRDSGIPDPSFHGDVSETIHKAYSGFVHAASPQIMDMCGGNPPRFHVAGLHGTPRMPEHRADALNYFVRGLLSGAVVAKAFGDAGLCAEMTGALEDFDKSCGPGSLFASPTEIAVYRRKSCQS